MILGGGHTRASEDLHFPRVEATIHVHLATGRTGRDYWCGPTRRWLVRRSQEQVRHVPVDEEKINTKDPTKRSRGIKPAPLVDIDEPKANKWRPEAPGRCLGLPVLSDEPAHCRLPRKSPFLSQIGAHPRKLLGAATCRKNAQLSPPRPSAEPLRPR